ncbi:MAG TPA: glycosyltransferase family 39 protein, partial [bacterium]|nr:glycosyltransferase family 39 protein [bacterium]
QLQISRLWLLAPLLPLGALVQVGWAGGKTTLPMLCLACMVLIVAVFLQDREQPVVVPELNANLRAVLAAGLGLPLQAWGAWLMWQYRYEMTGFMALSVGASWSLWALSRWPLRLAMPEEEAFKGDEWTVAQPDPFYTWKCWLPKLWLLGGAVICGYAAMFIYPASNQSLSVSLGFLGIFLLMASFPWLPGPLASSLALPKPWRPAVTLALACLAVLLGMHGQTLVEQNQTGSGMWWFLAAGIAAVLACAPRHLEGRTLSPEAEPPRWVEMAVVLSLLALAWLVHIWKIDIFPYAAEGDEAGGGVWAWDVLHQNLENPLMSSNVPLHFYSVTAVFFKLFGLSVGTMRLHAVVFGTLSIMSAYFFFRLFSGWAAALLGSLLMLFSYWHLHFSRFGHYNIEQVYCQMVAFYFVFKGLRNGRFWHFVAGGVAFGLAMQPHLASRLLPFEGLALVVYLALTARPSLRRHATGLLAFVVASWIVASPSLMYWFRATNISFARAG